MNAIQPAFAHRLEAIGDTFAAWRIADGNDSAAYPLECVATTLAEAVDSAAPSCCHKDTLLILATEGRSGRKTLHAFRIKQGKRTYRTDPLTRVAGFVAPLYAEKQFTLPVEDFAPVEPFRWTPGCDVVGVDRSVVEARS